MKLCKLCKKPLEFDRNKYCPETQDSMSCAKIRKILAGTRRNMLSRVYNKADAGFKYYCHLSVSDEWRDTRRGEDSFVAWALASGWKQGLHLDRINNDLGYSSENCRYITPKENMFNRRNNPTLTATRTNRCNRCYQYKPITEFPAHTRGLYKYKHTCQVCIDKIVEDFYKNRFKQQKTRNKNLAQ